MSSSIHKPCLTKTKGKDVRYPPTGNVAGILPSLHNLLNPENLLLQHELHPPKLPPQVPRPSLHTDFMCRHDKTTVLSPFRPQHVPVDPAKHLPALQEPTKKDETRHRPRISLYRWLGSHVQDEDQQRKVTFKTDGDNAHDKDAPPKENKDAIENVIQSLLEPKISSDETKEYERYPPQHHLVVCC